ncbi:MAG: DUF2065 domain-containing protein [Chromatiales bacterium]|nr:DUF2065 domain-containing protein [Chromatiales bacterium]
MWDQLLPALALVLVIEGILPFINPDGYSRIMAQMSQLDPRTIRFVGLGSMLAGLAMLYLVQ